MNIVILGGGVAGLTSAIALRRKGFSVEIYERHAKPTSIGAGMVLWPNACAILAQLELLSPLQAIAGSPRRMRRLSQTGEDLGSVDIGRINANMGFPSLALLRSDLQQVLLSALRALGLEVQYQHSVTSLEQNDGSDAVVKFSNGKCLRADLIIAADGRMASHGRRFITGDSRPHYQGFINWIGITEWQQSVFDESDILDYWGVGKRFGIVPVAPNKVYWAAGVASADKPDAALARQGDDGDDTQDILQRLFADWPQPVGDILQRKFQHPVNKIYVHDHDPTPQWHKANVLMIGDAAHAPLPTSGQGACQAIEDAWFLTEMLASSITPTRFDRTGMVSALTRFSQARMKKTSAIIHAARGFASSLYHRDPLFCEKRNQASRQSDFDSIADAMSGLWALEAIS